MKTKPNDTQLKLNRRQFLRFLAASPLWAAAPYEDDSQYETDRGSFAHRAGHHDFHGHVRGVPSDRAL